MGRCKKIVAVLLAFIMVLSLGSFVFGEESDIADHWAKEEIEYLMSKGVVSGYPDGSFKPDKQITRAEFVKMINYIFGYSEKGSVSFTDVGEGDWFYDEIGKAVKAGYISGYDDGTMKPNNPITRQEVSKVMGMVFDLNESEESAGDFVDADLIGDWAKGYVGILKDKGYISGYPDGTFKPGNPITRAESVKIVVNASGLIINAEGEYSEDAAGNVLVNTSDVVLKDMKIAGDLYLVEGIGDGTVTLDNVTVEGEVYIRGGGEDSIIIINSKTGQIFVKKAEGNVRLVLEGSTEVPFITLDDNGKLVIKEGAKIDSIKVIGKCSIEIEKGAEVGQIEVEAEGVEIESEGTVNLLIATEEVKVNGKVIEKDKEIKIEDGKAEEIEEEKPKESEPSGPSGPSSAERARTAFLADLKEEVKSISVADVEIDGEDITITFENIAVETIKGTADSFVGTLKGLVKEGTLTLNGETFDLKSGNVVQDVARSLLEEIATNPGAFISEGKSVEIRYTAGITNKNDVRFTLSGNLAFKVKNN
ncbi:MAG: S-layer homology domain-containing protein [Alkaliphilus sp.]|nr:S-layer homology domain-containing protein [Alkaliphilus sp.]